MVTCAHPLLGLDHGDLLVPHVLLGLLQALAEAGDGLLQLVLLPVDALHVRRSELLVLQHRLQAVVLLLHRLQLVAWQKERKK